MELDPHSRFKSAGDSSDVFLPVAEEPIDALRKRLAEGWVKFKRREAHERWGAKYAPNDLRDPQDPFVNWVMRQPEEVVRRFAAKRDESDRRITAHNWKKTFRVACVPIFRCAFVPNPDGNTGTFQKVSMESLLADEAYNLLPEGAQLVARYLVEKCQVQEPDGNWTLARVNPDDWVRADTLTSEQLAGVEEIRL